MFEAGVGVQTAELQWYCAWGHVALTDRKARADAVAQLARFQSFSVWNHMDYEGHRIFLRIENHARAADFRPLSHYVGQNCRAGGTA